MTDRLTEAATEYAAACRDEEIAASLNAEARSASAHATEVLDRAQNRTREAARRLLAVTREETDRPQANFDVAPQPVPPWSWHKTGAEAVMD